jgi:phage shock protein E
MKDLLKKATIIDVRTTSEFDEGHFPGAINIPVDQVLSKLGELKEMQSPIVAYCRSGARSGMAVSILKQNGLSEVYNAGGLDDIIQQSK